MNTLGQLFKVTSFGESHGSHVGCLIEGVPAGLMLDLEAMQQQVNRRKTNQQGFASARQEEDNIQCISGVFEGKTLGSPIALLIENKDAQSKDYDHLKHTFRPSHADFTQQMKYGFRDHRGGGRSSIRVTAPLVAAGELARQLSAQLCNLHVQAFVTQIGTERMSYDSSDVFTQAQIDVSIVRCPDAEASERMLQLIEKTHVAGDTLGGQIAVVIQDVPIGLGEPIFGKLQAQLAHAMLSINTVKGFEYGTGFRHSELTGSESNDAFMLESDKIKTSTNFSGGIQGGISNGAPIHFSIAFKPISSIKHPQQTVTDDLQQTTLEITGRHDTCAVPRAIPIVEAYTHIILTDLLLQLKHAKL